MAILPPDVVENKSTYKGALPSQKYFTPKELNNLAQVGKNKEPNSNKKIVKEELKKSQVKSNGNLFGQEQNSFAQYMQSQIPETKTTAMDQDQQDKLKKLSARPFDLKSAGGKSSRPQTGASNQATEKENNNANLGLVLDEEDVYESISMPAVNYKERIELLKQLDRREKDREELELEEVFKELKKKISNDNDIESLTNQSLLEMREEKQQMSIYKPNLKKQSQPQMKLQQQEGVLNFHPPQNVSALVPIPTGENGNSRLDQIYKQIKELQQFKDEIMDELDEYMVEANQMITIPEQFDEVVDIVVNEQRDRGEAMVASQEKGGQEVLDESGKPFWMQFLKADYLEEELHKTMDKTLKDLTEKEQKMKKELEKIRKLDAQLASQTKFARDLKTSIMNKQQQYQEQEEKKKSDQSIVTSSKGFSVAGKKTTTSTSKQTEVQSQNKKGKPQSKNDQIRKAKQSRAEDEGGDTFLTDLLRGNKASKKNSKVGSRKDIEEEEEEIDQEELQDVVYDYEQSQAVMQMAEDFLSNKQPILQLLGPEYGQSPSKGKNMNSTSMSFKSQMSGASSNKDFLSMNKDLAKNFNPNKKPMLCDNLDEISKQRLDAMMREIDENLESIKQEKEDYYNPDKSQISRMADEDNAYLYSKEDMLNIERINDKLKKVTPMLPSCEDFDSQASVIKSNIQGNNKESKIMSYNNDTSSIRSMAMSNITRRSNFTMLTMKTHQTALTKLPGERKLREIAEQRLAQAQMTEINQNLKLITETDDLSYSNQQITQYEQEQSNKNDDQPFQLLIQKRLIDQDMLSRLIEECREEEDRRSIMNEMNDDIKSESGYAEKSNMQLAKLDQKGRLYQEADQVLNDIEIAKQEYWKVLDSQKEREESINQISKKVEKLQEKNQNQEKQIQEKNILKKKVLQQETELKSILDSLDKNEQKLLLMKERDQQLQDKFEFDMKADANIIIKEDEREDDTFLDRVQNDIKEYQIMERQLEQAAIAEQEENLRILSSVERYQDGRDDQQDEVYQYVKAQLEQDDLQQ